MLLLSTNVAAQEQNGRMGGLFGEPAPTASNGLMNRNDDIVGSSFTGQGFGATNGNITGQTFGAPLGSGLLVLFMTGVGYAAIKTWKIQSGKEN